MNTALIKSTLNLYKKAIVKSALSIKNNILLVTLIFIMYTYIFPFIVGVLGKPMAFISRSQGASIISSVVVTIVVSLITSIVFKWYREILFFRKALKFKDLKSIETLKEFFKFDIEIFYGIISVGFITWIATSILSSLVAPKRMGLIYFLLLIIPFNVISEVIIVKSSRSLQIFSDALEFITSNFVEWFVFLLVLGLPAIFSYYSLETSIFKDFEGYNISERLINYLSISLGSDILSPGRVISLRYTEIIFSFWDRGFFNNLNQLSLWFWSAMNIFIVLVRLNLFTLLEENPRRQRVYKSKFL